MKFSRILGVAAALAAASVVAQEAATVTPAPETEAAPVAALEADNTPATWGDATAGQTKAGACAFHDLDYFAGVARIGLCPAVRRRVRLILLAHFQVTRKPSSSDQHALACRDMHRLTCAFQMRADDFAVLNIQIEQHGLGHLDGEIVRRERAIVDAGQQMAVQVDHA